MACKATIVGIMGYGATTPRRYEGAIMRMVGRIKFFQDSIVRRETIYFFHNIIE